ncbi:hypothetical protein Agabi119p4_807 [Agaricus bisporus var. burnettii]|uniref:Mid2 domain-containing protein n=1 Tax=Agaricus bisporus var. burnettii TaxID=192524 RepID=A0A8H7FB93_AGABI|nr:hypothetical protein Agabi119p4_807 [Agaricus bisporus var. burnettii]
MLSWSYNTFIAYLVVALAVSAVHASDEFQPTRRGHANLKRMIKKREPQQEPPTVIPVIGAGQDPAENPPVTTTSAEVSTTAASTTAVSETLSTTASSTGASGIPDLVNTLLSGLVSGTTSATTSQTSSSTSSSSSVSSTATTSSSSTPTTEAPTTPPPPPAPVVTSTHSGSTSTVIKTQEQADAATSVPAPTGAAATKSKTLEIIIIVASSIGGIAILWTVFRKWKLGRSSKFDERLQPIDWQKPTGENNNNNDIMPGVRRAPSSASSFHSASVHGHHGDAANLQPIPEHDFTAGVAPVGGYADLARGPSPPMGQVHSGAALGRGYEYDNGVPLHHQAGGAYGAYDYQGGARY